MRESRAIISLENLAFNIRQIRNAISKDAKLCVAVKADAYGHGAVECSKTILKNGGDVLAVATVDEGKELRENGIESPILLLSLCSPNEVECAVKNKITPFAFDEEYISLFEKSAEKLGENNVEVYLAIDTGMGRIGCYENEAGKLAEFIKSCPHLKFGGISTHLAASDCADEESINYTQFQIKRFKNAVKNVEAAGIDSGVKTCANSAAGILLKEANFDLVRVGIIAYGYYPGDFTREYFEKNKISFKLKPVMTLETTVCSIRKIKKGMSVGYGRTWTASEDTEIAVLPIGYADGLLRRYGECGLKVAIDGKEYPVRGRICMDQCMVEIGENSGIKRWAKAVIFGSNDFGAMQDADKIARQSGTISYEVTSCITKRIKRYFVN